MIKPQSFDIPLELLLQHFGEAFLAGEQGVEKLLREVGDVKPGIVAFADFFSDRHGLTKPENGHCRLAALVMCKAFEEVHGAVDNPGADEFFEADARVKPFYDYLLLEDEKGMQAAYTVFRDNHLSPSLLQFITFSLLTAKSVFAIAGDPVQHEIEIVIILWVVAEVLVMMKSKKM